MVFCNFYIIYSDEKLQMVTILILIDGFLQSKLVNPSNKTLSGHNPYFNRWFSAIYYNAYVVIKTKSHNPYFNRWFSAITLVFNCSTALLWSQSLF